MGGGAPQPRLREVSVPVVSKSFPHPRSPTYPLGTVLNRVSPSPQRYRINKFSVNAAPPPPPPSGAHPIVYQKPFYAYAWYPLLKNRSSIITSPLIRGMSEWVS